jgi:hypothetical protein
MLRDSGWCSMRASMRTDGMKPARGTT